MSSDGTNVNTGHAVDATALLSLPNEILAQVAWIIAPEGGAQACALGLTCRRLAHIVAPVTWASLYIPLNWALQLALMSHVASPSCPTRAHVRSVHIEVPPYANKAEPGTSSSTSSFCPSSFSPFIALLPRLERLHLSGPPDGSHLPRPALHECYLVTPPLRQLILEGFELAFCNYLANWGGKTDRLELRRCHGSSWLYLKRHPSHRNGGELIHTALKTLVCDFTGSSSNASRDSLVALASSLPTVISVRLRLPALKPVHQASLFNLPMADVPLRYFSLDVPDLFNTVPTNRAPGALVTILNLLGRSHIHRVTLTMRGVPELFADEFDDIRMPRLRELVLHHPCIAPLLPAASGPALVVFLNSTSFPALKTLVLHGWTNPLGSPAGVLAGLDALKSTTLDMIVFTCQDTGLRVKGLYYRPDGKGEWSAAPVLGTSGHLYELVGNEFGL